LKVLNSRKKFILGIRTASVHFRKRKRRIDNFILKSESFVFKHITVISKDLAKSLGLGSKAKIMPVGAEARSPRKSLDSIRLLYVGSLTNRNIHETLYGFAKFNKHYGKSVELSYTIIGNGYGNELNVLKKIVRQNSLDDIVQIRGQIPHDKITAFFDQHNIGIAFIPMTEYFDVQPATKMFEYLLAGMPVIATATRENSAIINEFNGILIQDNSESFYRGLVRLYKNIATYDSRRIREMAMPYSWESIIGKFLGYMQSVMDGN
jgi:glycosyltransferase involved in cell wall biosynthesis